MKSGWIKEEQPSCLESLMTPPLSGCLCSSPAADEAADSQSTELLQFITTTNSLHNSISSGTLSHRSESTSTEQTPVPFISDNTNERGCIDKDTTCGRPSVSKQSLVLACSPICSCVSE